MSSVLLYIVIGIAFLVFFFVFLRFFRGQRTAAKIGPEFHQPQRGHRRDHRRLRKREEIGQAAQQPRQETRPLPALDAAAREVATLLKDDHQALLTVLYAIDPGPVPAGQEVQR